MALSLHGHRHVDTCQLFRVLNAYVIVTWGIGHMYNPPKLNIPLNCLDLINRKENIVPDGVILI